MSRGHRREKRLVDMATKPEPEVYSPSPKSAGNEHEWHIVLGEADRLFIRQHVYKGKTVDFAVVQLHLDADGVEHQVAVIDCCHGTVHRHVYDRAGTDLIDKQPIQVIPAKNGQDTVTLLFDECYERMMNEYDANLRRWQRT